MANKQEEWPTLAWLARVSKAEQRRILRLHREGSFAGAEERDAVSIRGNLDRELERIMARELLAQMDPDINETYADIPHFARLLKESPAFVQYLNYYLYFGVRFAAGRIPEGCPPSGDAECACAVADCNEPVVGLPRPPFVKPGWPTSDAVGPFLNRRAEGDEADPLIETALRFLDDFVNYSDIGAKLQPDDVETSDAGRRDGDERRNFELWLRGLYIQTPRDRFRILTAGLLRWARDRYDFYTGLESHGAKREWVETWKTTAWKEGRWNVNNPLVARCAIVDFYWLARVLRAEVSARGKVSYSSHSWLYLMAMKESPFEAAKEDCRRIPGLPSDEPFPLQEDILRCEEVLRSVFGYACDLIQNAVEVAEEGEDREKNPEEYLPPALPLTSRSRTKAWRAVSDKELGEIRAQRKEWRYDAGPSAAADGGAKYAESEENPGWSRRIWTGEDIDNPVGIALSGGGIRSATFGLGVLQRLQELDLLRHVDYLSTVSGGGYIGAWMVGNVRRTRYWLSHMTSWDKSIEHLRRYSSYLAPHNGALRADTWTMWGTWIRNAFLIQLTGFTWLAFMLVSILVSQPLFLWSGSDGPGVQVARALLVLSLLLISLILVFFLWHLSRPRTATTKKDPPGTLYSWIVTRGDLLPKAGATLAWLASFLTGALLWGQALRTGLAIGRSYSGILANSWRQWGWPINFTFFFSIWALGFACLQIANLQATLLRRAGLSLLTAIATSLTAYLCLCGLLRLYSEFVWGGSLFEGLQRGGWLAFVLGPVIVMAGSTLAIVVFIGLLGRDVADWNREWWTRYGAWIGMIGAAALVFSVAAVFAPLWVYRFAHLPLWGTVKAGAVLGWLGSVVGGLLAGKSARTRGEGGHSSPGLEKLARIGGFLFIAGAIAIASTVIYFVLGEILMEDFDPASYWQNLTDYGAPKLGPLPTLWAIMFLLFALARLFSMRFDLNTFGLNQFYRNRLVRCYLGATRWEPGKRHPHRFTAFDPLDDVNLAALKVSAPGFCEESFRGPFPIVNCTLNLGGSSDLTVHTRQSAPFTLTPLFCGTERKKVGYAPTSEFAIPVTLGQAIAVSGAAASPNMGYNTSPLVSFLLTMFNVRLGWWFPNPGSSSWNQDRQLSALNLVWELFGLADEREDFINLSDGGHFENLGIYELIRRRTRVIIAADAECDSDLSFGSLGNVIRICETDFGAKIDLDVASIRKQEETGVSRAHCAVGKITYSNGTLGYIIYIKSSLTADEDVGVAQYRSGHPTFPHETTANQFFSEDQFEAYRRLGHHITERTFRSAENEAPDLFVIAGKLFDLWVPASFSNEAFLTHAKAFDQLLDRFRTDGDLVWLFHELTGSEPLVPPPPAPLSARELCACMETMQLMENVFLDLRLDDFWEHPDNRGWAMFFTMCARSGRFRAAWRMVRRTYGIRFEYFCNQHLGLEKDAPVVRV